MKLKEEKPFDIELMTKNTTVTDSVCESIRKQQKHKENGLETAKFLNVYHDTVFGEPTREELDYIRNYEIRIADALIKDFGEDSARRIGNIIIAATNGSDVIANKIRD